MIPTNSIISNNSAPQGNGMDSANGSPGNREMANTIPFNMPDEGAYTIQPTSALQTIADPVVIDGYT